MDTELSLALSNSISEKVGSVATDLLEIGLDAVLEDGVLKEIPILSTMVSLFKIGNSVKERHDVRKLAAFVAALNNGIIDEEKRDYYKKIVRDNPAKRDKELEHILIIINRYVHINKAELLAKFYLAYLDEEIDWNSFSKAAEILDRLLPGDFQELENNSWSDLNDSDVSDSLLRLISLGLVITHSKAVNVVAGTLVIPDAEIKDYELTIFGSMFLRYLSA